MSSVAPVVQNPFRQQFAAFTADRREPDAIARLRREGLDRFASLGWPTGSPRCWKATTCRPGRSSWS